MRVSLTNLIENEFFICCPLLKTDHFVDYCKKRGVEISSDRLERLEQLGLFYPLARINRFELSIKIEYTENGRSYFNRGVLKEGEEWDGGIKKELAHMPFSKEYALEWLNCKS
jgi:hypothetical protein